MSESQRIKPYGWRSQYAESTGLSRWYDCPDEDVEHHAARGALTRTLYLYVDQPILYAHTAPSSELVIAAEETATEIEKFLDGRECHLDLAYENLRAALDKIKCPAPAPK